MTRPDVDRTVEAVWRMESARIVGLLARMLRDVGLAEELAQDAMLQALESGPADGVPDRPAPGGCRWPGAAPSTTCGAARSTPARRARCRGSSTNDCVPASTSPTNCWSRRAPASIPRNERERALLLARAEGAGG